jgi:sialate O-acetylesterase
MVCRFKPILSTVAFSILLVAARAFSLASIFTNGAVLQRNSDATTVWGFGTPGATVETRFSGSAKSFSASVDSKGIWRQPLPATPAGGPKSVVFRSDGKELVLNDVLFGDVFLCSGQSNMYFAVSQVVDAGLEMSRALDYGSLIRFVTVSIEQAEWPLTNLRGKPPSWQRPTRRSIKYFSAMCWFFGRDISDALDRKVPIGLIAASYPSSPIQAWGPRGFASHCDAMGGSPATPQGQGPVPANVLWNAMIAPLAVGPLALKGIAWYQGESDRYNPSVYACAFPALINRWRAEFKAPDLYFGFVLVAPCGGDVAFRAAQMAAAALPRVGYATAEDFGDLESPYECMHPRYKQAPAARLALSALDIAYARSDVTPWRLPTLAAAQGLQTPEGEWEVRVSFSPESLSGGGIIIDDKADGAQCPPRLRPHGCARPTLICSDGSSHLASISLTEDGGGAAFKTAAAGAPRRLRPTRVLYAHNTRSHMESWPLYSLYSSHVVKTRYDRVLNPVRSFSAKVLVEGFTDEEEGSDAEPAATEHRRPAEPAAIQAPLHAGLNATTTHPSTTAARPPGGTSQRGGQKRLGRGAPDSERLLSATAPSAWSWVIAVTTIVAAAYACLAHGDGVCRLAACLASRRWVHQQAPMPMQRADAGT